ncbi:MAG: hypothetical protein LCH52_16500 [Bacteroidetes bacterium]|nr:hypothetical protein [Bacteroidota bacterium]
MSFTIGCDPELILRLDGAFVPASKFFKRNSSFGLDGCNSVAELRPGFSESPIDLTAKLKIIIGCGHEKHPELEMFSGHYQSGYPIGGHIHLSVNPQPNIVDSLDTVLYSLSDCIDDRAQRKSRENTGYGKRLAYREKSHGMEYRTPGSWCLSPTTALVTLTLAKLTVIAVTEDGLNLKDFKKNLSSRTFLRKLESMLVTIPDDCQEGLTELTKLINKKLDWDQNILPNWGLAA